MERPEATRIGGRWPLATLELWQADHSERRSLAIWPADGHGEGHHVESEEVDSEEEAGRGAGSLDCESARYTGGRRAEVEPEPERTPESPPRSAFGTGTTVGISEPEPETTGEWLDGVSELAKSLETATAECARLAEKSRHARRRAGGGEGPAARRRRGDRNAS